MKLVIFVILLLAALFAYTTPAKVTVYHDKFLNRRMANGKLYTTRSMNVAVARCRWRAWKNREVVLIASRGGREVTRVRAVVGDTMAKRRCRGAEQFDCGRAVYAKLLPHLKRGAKVSYQIVPSKRRTSCKR